MKGKDHKVSVGMLIQVEISRSLQMFRSEAQQGGLISRHPFGRQPEIGSH